MEETRVAVIAIIVEDLGKVDFVNECLHEYGRIIIGRMGLPYRQRGISIITVSCDGKTDEINSLSGKIGRIEGVSAKTLYAKI